LVGRGALAMTPAMALPAYLLAAVFMQLDKEARRGFRRHRRPCVWP